MEQVTPLFHYAFAIADIGFVMEPALRFTGKRGEQTTMFFLDPDGNALEFKAFTRPEEVFARQSPD